MTRGLVWGFIVYFKYSPNTTKWNNKKNRNRRLKPNKKFITTNFLQRGKKWTFLIVSIFSRGYRYQYPLDIITIGVLVAQFSLEFFFVGGHGTRFVWETKTRGIFTAHFSATCPNIAIRLCLIQCITNSTEVVSNLKLIPEEKICRTTVEDTLFHVCG